MNVLVVDASAIVALMTDAPEHVWISEQLAEQTLVAPAHVGAEVLSAVGRRYRAGLISARTVERALRAHAQLPLRTHSVESLLLAAWARRDRFRLADALYIELAAQLETVVITTDRRLAGATPLAVAPPGD